MTTTIESPQMMNREQAAAYLGVTIGTLNVWASTGRYNLPFIKVGRSVRYRRDDLDRWLEERTVHSTSDSN